MGFGTQKFFVRYGILHHSEIVNYCGPRNEYYIKRLNERNGFFQKLEESIKSDGIRNPIIVIAGKQGCPNLREFRLPQEWKADWSNIVVCDRNGGSRLYTASKLDLSVPCIVCDYINKFPHFETLKTKEEIMSKYKDRPKDIRINQYGIHIRKLPQVHIETDG